MEWTQLGMRSEAGRVLERCRDAAQAAEHCARACTEAGDAERARCIRLCNDVADLASATAKGMARGSGWHPKLAQVCLDACLTCADECARFDDEACQVAEEALRACAEACQDVASGGPVTEESVGDASAHGGRSPFSGYFDEDR